MTEGWAFGGQPPNIAGATPVVTLVEGSTFCLSTSNGSVVPGLPHGLFVRDTRFLAGWLLDVNGARVEPLSNISREPFAAVFLTRARPPEGRADSVLLVTRHRYIGDGMREDVTIRNVSGKPVSCTMTLAVEVDFADLFEVKEGRVPDRGPVTWHSDGRSLHASRDEAHHGVRIVTNGATEIDGGHISWEIEIPGRGEWHTCLQVIPIVDERALLVRHPCGAPAEGATPATRLRQWRTRSPVVSSASPALDDTVRRSLEDLGSLRIFDPDYPNRAVVAAGAPWFMTLFGRDSLLASYMMLPLDPQLALGTLQTLARFQGTVTNPSSEEQPGRILHEMRFGSEASLALGGGNTYYGTADATPLFVMVLGELQRWGVEHQRIEELMPNADRALAWIDEYGDRDGDGFVEYKQMTEHGLANQGWKDSWDGINFADGRLAEAPIALCEVQGYVYAAFTARAHFARENGDHDAAGYWSERGKRLKRAFNQAFWLPDKGWYAVGLDRDKRPIDALTSNIGHCLWTGIIDADKAGTVVRHLMSPAMFGGWGIRTLASTMAAYNPMSYHNGSVWPHDNALLATGLMRYGYVAEAQQVAIAMLGTASHFGGRLPELFCGFDRDQYDLPVPYPTACSPQAWAAAAPIQLLRTLLRLDPWVPAGQVWMSPVIPDELLPIRIDNLNLAQTPTSIVATPHSWEVTGLSDDLTLIREPRPWPDHGHAFTA